MHVTVDITDDTTEGFNRRMRVEIPEDRIVNDVNEQLESLIPNAKMPGFRPGKVPLKLLVRRYGEATRNDVVNKLIYSTFQEALARENLQLANGPEVRELNSDSGKGLTYTAAFDVYPPVEIPALESLEVRRPVSEVTEEDLDRMMETLRKQSKTWSEVDQPAVVGNRVIVDFEGIIREKPPEGSPPPESESSDAETLPEPASPRTTKGSKVPVELGAEQMIEGFEEGLIGVSAGDERVLDLRFPDEYHKSELAGCPVTFTVKALSVEEGGLPETDLDFAKQFGIEDGSMDTFRAATRKDMESKLEAALRNETNRKVIDALLANNPISELPRNVVLREANAISARKRREFANFGIDPDKLDIQPSKFEQQAHEQITLNLLLEKLVSAANITVEPDSIKKRVEAIASDYQDPRKMIAWYYADEQRLMPIKMMVLQDRVVDWVLEHANVTEERTSFDALLNPLPHSASNSRADTEDAQTTK
uniref:Trigger factor n=1 Tax=Candidatus Kentrum sp. SD TaxID=2126332 RepID=A0A451BI11_9GAMM|nr:MAG: trigger factor [Candidatus Kentron sp. SD]